MNGVQKKPNVLFFFPDQHRREWLPYQEAQFATWQMQRPDLRLLHLTGLMERGGAAPQRWVFCLATRNDRAFQCVLDDAYKYVQYQDGEELLFSRANDVWEDEDLAPQNPDLVAWYARKIAEVCGDSMPAVFAQ